MDLEFCGLFTLCRGWNSFPITWTVAQSDDSGNGSGEKAQNYDAALTMSAFCISNSIVYFLNFIFAKRARNMYLAEEAGRW